MNATSCPVCLEDNQDSIYSYRKNDFPNYVKCDGCDSLFLCPMPNQNDLNKYYENLAISGTYSNSMGKYRINSIDKFLKLSNISDYKVNWLDFGCFDGFLLKRVRDFGATVYGVEIQEIARLEANLVAEGKVVSDLKLLGNPVIQVISMKDSIEHVLNPDLIFSDITEIAASNAKIIIQTPNASSLTARILRGRWPGLNSPEHTIVFSEHGLEVFLQRHGWAINQKMPISKKLSIGYVLHQLSNFGGFTRLAKSLEKILPVWVKNYELNFVGGEFIVSAHKL